MGKLTDLPKDIVFEILSRLPTENALDSKLVCKPWRDLVRQPSFGQKHLDRLNDSTNDDDSGDKVCFIYLLMNQQQWKQELYYVECVEENDAELLLSRKSRMNLSSAYDVCYFIGSCNGIICFSSWVNGKNLSCDYGPVYVANPITREYVILPDMDGIYYWTGFGYSASTNKYKVVIISLKSNYPNFGIAQVYTLGSGNGWRNVAELGMKWKNMKHIEYYAGAFANEALHWVNHDNGAILAFSLIDEKFSELRSPPLTRAAGLGLSIDLGVLGDFLIAVYHPDYDRSEIWIWKKNKDNSNWSWSKQFCFGSLVDLPFELMKSGRHLCRWGVDIYSYDPKVSSAKMSMGLGKGKGMAINGAIPHQNTLVSLEALGETGTKTMEVGERAR